MSASLKKKIRFQERRSLIPNRERRAEKSRSAPDSAPVHIKGGGGGFPSFGIAGACHSSKSGAFGSQFKRGRCRQAGAPGALPTGNLVAQMFRMPAQAASAEAKPRGQFGATAGKLGNRHSFHRVRGAARLFWPDTHTHTHTDKSGEPRAV